jgi:hypothetical protein
MIPEEIRRRAPAWSRIMGFGSVRWSKDGAYEGDLHWSLEEVPVVGEEYSVNVSKSMQTPPGESFWTLFQPAYSLINGWEESPSELGLSCLVHCQALAEIETDWQAVRVNDVAGIREIPRRFPPERSGAVPELPTQRRTRVDWEDLTVCVRPSAAVILY